MEPQWPLGQRQSTVATSPPWRDAHSWLARSKLATAVAHTASEVQHARLLQALKSILPCATRTCAAMILHYAVKLGAWRSVLSSESWWSPVSVNVKVVVASLVVNYGSKRPGIEARAPCAAFSPLTLWKYAMSQLTLSPLYADIFYRYSVR